MGLPQARAAAIALLAALLTGVVDPNEREPELDMGTAVTALSMGATSGWIAAGTTDPGGPADVTSEETWTLWDDEGSLQRTDDANEANCGALDPCSADVTDIAVSASGNRIAIAARDKGQEEGRIVFFTTTNGLVSRQEVPEMPSSLAFTDSGVRLAVGLAVPGAGVNDPDTGAVRLYTWSVASGGNPGTVSQTYRTATDGPVTQVAIDEDVRVAAAAGNDHYRFSAIGSAFEDGVDSPVVSVAFARDSDDHWSVAGQSDGGVLLYSDDSDTVPFTPVLDLRPGTAAVNAVAIAHDGDFFVTGDQAGRLRLFNNHFVGGSGGTGVVVATTDPLDGPVRDLAISNDGRYLAVAAGQGVYLYRVSATSLQHTWTDDAGADVSRVAISADGGVVAAAHGSKVAVYEALPVTTSIQVDAPDDAGGQPGETQSVVLTYRNAGNREAAVSLDEEVPSNWDAVLGTQAFTLQPEEERQVHLNVTPNLGAGEGDYTLRVTHRVAGVATAVTIPFEVGKVRLWTVETDGPLLKDVEAGGTATFRLTVTNLGNGNDTTDVEVDLDDETWTAEAEPDTLTLEPEESEEVVVRLTSPAGATELEAVEATVRLTADDTAGVTLGAVVGAEFGVSLDVVGSSTIEAEQGETATVELRLTNEGNAADSFEVRVGALPRGWEADFGADPPFRVEGLQPGSSRSFEVDLSIPEDEEERNVQLAFTAESLGDDEQRDTATVVVQVPELVEEKKKDNDSPGLGFAVLVAALVGAVVVFRRLS